MPKPTVAEIMTDSASLLGDPAKERFTDAVQAPFYGMAYREMFDIMIRWRLLMAETERYALLPAYTNTLIPSSNNAAIFDLGEPSRVWERGGLSSYGITGHYPGGLSPLIQPTALVTNDEVTASGFIYPPEANGKWLITVSGASPTQVISLNGAPAFGASAFSGPVAKLTKSSEKFQEMIPVGDIPQIATADTLRWWKWENDTFYFNPCTAIRELRIEYTASGTPPASGTILVDNSRNFLAARTASLAALMNDMPTRGEQLVRLALGSSGEADGTGGYLRDLVIPMLKEKQKRPMSPQPFRPNRNALTRQIW